MTKKHHLGTSSIDANWLLTEDHTQTVIRGIQSLPGNPRTGYLVSTFLSKFVSSETDPADVRRTRAINIWLATERNNRATNHRLLCFDPDYQICPGTGIGRFVEHCREVIERIVGELPDDSDFIGGFSGGASTSRARTASHPAGKYLGRADVTEEALPLFNDLRSLMPGWFSFPDIIRENVVEGNILFTVPKNSEKDRCACKEPDLNMFMQRGLGSRIRKDLRRVGIDLNDQSRNRKLAYEGSVDGSLATIDLSSASDSVSHQLVRLLMPLHWYIALDTVRCRVTDIDGVKHTNEMFSSMGNGFTFELESLLFYALARTTAYFCGISGVISVYGDDIVVPTTLSVYLQSVLRFFGFETNVEKTFDTGTFRESCGGHYDDGRDITPFYLRQPIDRLTDLIHFANSLRHWGSVEYINLVHPSVWPLWSFCRDLVPKSLWGGRDCSSKFQLVTPHSPRMVLRPLAKKKATGLGGYIHWLSATHRRSADCEIEDAVETSQASDVIGLCRKVKWHGMETQLSHIFFEENGDTE